MSLDILLPVSLILLFGMPHGAADGAIALSLYRGRAQRLLFITGYILLAAAVIGLWGFAPGLFLGGFLLISAYHFGQNDRQSYHYNAPIKWPVALAHGGSIILCVPLFRPDDVWPIFELLAPGSSGSLLATMQFAMPAWLLLVVLAVIQVRQKKLFVAETAAIVTAAYLLPPLWAFTLYFCCVHSARHMYRLWPLVKDKRRMIGVIVSFTVISVVAVLVMAYDSSITAPDDALLKATLITLFALTLPHMLFIDGFRALNRLGLQ